MYNKHKISIDGTDDAVNKIKILFAFGFLFTPDKRISSIEEFNENYHSFKLRTWSYFVIGIDGCDCEKVFSVYRFMDDCIVGSERKLNHVFSGELSYSYFDSPEIFNYKIITLDELLYMRNMNAMVNNEEEAFTFDTPISEYFTYVSPV